MEEHLQGRKKLLFPLVVALITCLDLFTMYMASWLILLYMSTRLAMIKGKMTIREYLSGLGKPFLYYLLGLGMAGAVFVMDAIILLSSNRVGGNSGSIGFFVTPGGFFRLLTSLFSPVINDYDFNIFSSPFQEGTIRTYALFSYSFILCPMLLPQLAVTTESRLKPVRNTLLGLFVCALIPVFYYLFNGNQASRWCFYFIVFHVMAIVFLLEHHELLDRALLKKSCIGCMVLLLCFTAAALLMHTAANRRALLMIVPFLILALAGYGYALERENRKLFCFVLLAEALFCLSARVVNGTTVTIGTGERAVAYETALFDTSVSDEIKHRDSGFYRIATDETTAENYLLPMAKHFRGNSFYFSIYTPASYAYYHRRISEDWFLPYLPSKFLSYGVFGNTYLIQNDPESAVPFGYEPLFEMTNQSGTDVRVYHRDTRTAFGYAGDVKINAAYADEADRSLQDYLLVSGVLCEEGVSEPAADEKFVSLGSVTDGVCEYPFSHPGTLFLDYSSTEPFGEGSYELYRSGEVIAYREFSEYGYHAVRIDEPCDAVGIYAHNANFTSAPIEVHLYWIEDDALQEVYDLREACDPLVYKSFDGRTVNAEITVHGDTKMVATAVPYDPGWKVTVNETEIVPQIVNTSFIGFELPEGTYEVQFVYTPRGLWIGCAVSLISVMIFVVLLLRQNRRNDAV